MPSPLLVALLGNAADATAAACVLASVHASAAKASDMKVAARLSDDTPAPLPLLLLLLLRCSSLPKPACKRVQCRRLDLLGARSTQHDLHHHLQPGLERLTSGHVLLWPVQRHRQLRPSR